MFSNGESQQKLGQKNQNSANFPGVPTNQILIILFAATLRGWIQLEMMSSENKTNICKYSFLTSLSFPGVWELAKSRNKYPLSPKLLRENKAGEKVFGIREAWNIYMTLCS